MKIANKTVRLITSILSILSFVGFFFIMGITTCDIIIRYVTGDSILGVYEIVERVMVCAVFASFAYTQSERGHVRITLLTAKYPPKLDFVMQALNYLLCAAASIFVAYAALRQAGVAISSNYTTGILLIPLFPFYYVELVAMVVLCIAFLWDTAINLVALFRRTLVEDFLEERGA